MPGHMHAATIELSQIFRAVAFKTKRRPVALINLVALPLEAGQWQGQNPRSAVNNV